MDVVQNLLNERVIVETAAADRVEILIASGLVAVCAEACHRGQCKFFACVVVDQFIQRDDGVFPLFHDVGGLAAGYGGKVDFSVTFDGVIGPSPFITVIMVEDVAETLRKNSHIIYCFIYHIVTDSLDFRSRGDKA